MTLKKIVLINQSAGYLFIDVAKEFSEVYDEVILITGNSLEKDVLPDNIKLESIYPYKKKSTVSRFISWIIGFVQLITLVQLRYRSHELFISSNPPLAALLPLFCKNKASLLIYDVYPDGLVSGGFISISNVVYRIWKYLNIKAYAKVERVVSITSGMSNLLSTYTSSDKITMIPVWADRKIFEFRNNGTNRFQKKFGLEDKFIVMYSGNLGKNHALESLVQVADNVKHLDNVKFVIAGEGWKKKIVENMVEELNLENCTILSYMSTDLFISSLYGVDVGVISLGEETSKIAIPSKTFNLLAAGKPLLCFANKDSDLADLVKNYDVGETFAHNEIEEATEYLKSLLENRPDSIKRLSDNAGKASQDYSFKNAVKMAELIYSHHQAADEK